ncbi:UDP binding domain-containing protein, partial [Rhodovulum marinum]
VEDPYGAAAGADAVVLLTEWNEFRGLDLTQIAGAMAAPRMADLRNVYPPEDVKAAGFQAYVAVGRPGFGLEG